MNAFNPNFAKETQPDPLTLIGQVDGELYQQLHLLTVIEAFIQNEFIDQGVIEGINQYNGPGDHLLSLLDIFRRDLVATRSNLAGADTVLRRKRDIAQTSVGRHVEKDGERTAFATSVGKCVDMHQRSDWSEAVKAYREADKAGADEDQAPAVQALNRLSTARAPDLRCIHEKMTILAENEYLNSQDAVNGLLADVDCLARKFEIAGRDAPDVHDAADGAFVVEA